MTAGGISQAPEKAGRRRRRSCQDAGHGWSLADVQQFVIERRLTMSARDYVGHLSTISAYLELPSSEQEQVYSRIMQVLPETIEIAADITVHLARRRCQQ